MSSRLRTSPMNAGPMSSSSSIYSQSTPAFHSSRLHSLDASNSSSPPNDVIQTPRDGEHIGGRATRASYAKAGVNIANANAKAASHAPVGGARRSVRVRGSSSGESALSSPVIQEQRVNKEHLSEIADLAFVPPSLPSSSSVIGSQQPSRRVPPSSSSAPGGRAPLPPRPTSSSSASSTSNTLAMAQAHGISAEVFEEAKQQVMRFLRTDSLPPQQQYEIAQHQQQQQQQQQQYMDSKGKSKQTPVGTRSQTYPMMYAQQQQQLPQLAPSSASSHTYRTGSPHHGHSYHHHQQNHHHLDSSSAPNSAQQAPPSQHATFDAFMSDRDQASTPYHHQQQQGVVIRSRPSLEEFVQRSAERPSRVGSGGGTTLAVADKVRQWAEQQSHDGSSSGSSDGDARGLRGGEEGDEEDEEDDEGIQKNLVHSTSTAPLHHRRVITPIRPSSSASSLDHHSNPSSAAGGSAQKGMMERFMTDRVKSGLELDVDDDEPLTDLDAEDADNEQEDGRTRRGQSDSPPVPGSPPQPLSNINNNSNLLMSPPPTRGHPASVFDSPDVSRLLTSELNELNANSAARREAKKSSSPGVPMANDSLYSSPYADQSAFDSDGPYANSGVKRSRDVFTADESDSAKRSRWGVQHQSDDNRAISPTPSSAASLSFRAPSFCDSSPAMSDRSGTRNAPFLPTTTHPASAPDFAYHGAPPSSSPESSQHSYSEPPPRQYRSSPGPSAVNYAYSSYPRQQQQQPLPQLQQQQQNHHHAPAPLQLHAPIPIARHHQTQPPTPTHFIDQSQFQRKPRLPLRRAETSPASLCQIGPDGNYIKPSWSYAALIGQAIFSVEEQKISLADIYAFIMTTYPFYKKEDSGWQNSIRHNLSLNECFIKTARGPNNPGKGCLWAIAEGCEDQFENGGFTKKGSTTTAKKGKQQPGQIPSSASRPSSAAARFDPTGLLRPSPPSSSPGPVGYGRQPPQMMHHQPSHGYQQHPPQPYHHPHAGLHHHQQPQQQQHIQTHAIPLSRKDSLSYDPTPVPSSRAESPTGSVPSPQTYTPVLQPLQLAPDFSPAKYNDDSSPSPPPTSVPILSRSMSFDSRPQQPVMAPQFDQNQYLTSPPPAIDMETDMEMDVKADEEREQSPTHPVLSPVVRVPTPVLVQVETPPVVEAAPPAPVPTPPPAVVAPTIERSASVASSRAEPVSAVVEEEKPAQLAPAYEPRPVMQPPPIESRARRAPGPAPPAASPPTSVYRRLEGPYQPMSFSGSSANHRALALLASPEAAGIMPVLPDVYDRPLPPILQSPSRHSHFLPAPQIFPGRRARAGSEEKEDERPQSMISPNALHTQSPVSSIRGAPRAPMSPLQTTEEKPSASADPEKKRTTTSRSHLPSVAALVDGGETFKTPPRLRSPSARAPATGASGIVTPGGRARPWGMPKDDFWGIGSTPGNRTPFGGRRAVDDSSRETWSPFGSRAQVEAEIEHFSMAGDVIRGSGIGPSTPRLHWSPSAHW